MIEPDRLHTTRVTCSRDGREHHATEGAFKRWRDRTADAIIAICEWEVLPSASILPIGEPCAACQEQLAEPEPAGPVATPVDVADLCAKAGMPLQRDRHCHRPVPVHGALHRLLHREAA